MNANATSGKESTDTEHVNVRFVLHDLAMDHTALDELPDFEPYCAAVESTTDALETAINRGNDY